MKKLTTLTTFLIYSFILAGCIEPDTVPNGTLQSTDNPGAKLCALFPAETITKLIGEPNSSHQLENLNKDTAGCSFSNSAEPAYSSRNFNIISLTAADEAEAKSNYDRATGVWRNSEVSNRTLINLEDFETEALWSPSTALSQLITYKDKTMIIVTLGHLPLSDDEQLQTAKSLAETTLNAKI